MEPAFIPNAPEDSALQDVFEAVKTMDPDGGRLARVTRQTFDQLYDGQRTGRFRLDQLHKTEKTHFGTLFEINLQREFSFEEGRVLDFRIAGHEIAAIRAGARRQGFLFDCIDRLCRSRSDIGVDGRFVLMVEAIAH